MQSREELLDPGPPLPPIVPDDDDEEPDVCVAEDDDEAAEAAAAATTAAAAATPAPDVPEEAMTPWPRTSVVWTLLTSRMLEINTVRMKERKKKSRRM